MTTSKEEALKIVNDMLKLTREQFPKWHINFTGNVSFVNSKRAMGFATSNGDIKLNSVYLECNEIEQMKHTILHEFAHLVCGLHHHHDKQFRAVESHLCRVAGVSNKSVTKAESAAMGIKHKYSVTYHLVNGTSIDQPTNRMTKALKAAIQFPSLTYFIISKKKVLVESITWSQNY